MVPVHTLARAARAGAVLAIVLAGIAAVAPMPAFADNGSNLVDLWAAFDQAVFAGMATPVLIWAANKARLPPEKPPAIEQLASEFINTDIANAAVRAPAPDPGRARKAAP